MTFMQALHVVSIPWAIPMLHFFRQDDGQSKGRNRMTVRPTIAKALRGHHVWLPPWPLILVLLHFGVSSAYETTATVSIRNITCNQSTGNASNATVGIVWDIPSTVLDGDICDQVSRLHLSVRIFHVNDSETAVAAVDYALTAGMTSLVLPPSMPGMSCRGCCSR